MNERLRVVSWVLLWLSVALSVVSGGMTVYCVATDGGRALARNLVYLTFISHLSLLFGALGMAFAALAFVGSLRAEQAAGAGD